MHDCAMTLLHNNFYCSYFIVMLCRNRNKNMHCQSVYSFINYNHDFLYLLEV